MSNKVSSYLDDIPVLKGQTERLRRVQKLQRIYDSLIPVHLARASRIADINDNTLIIIAFNGITAAGLKQRLPSVLAGVQALETEISAVRVEVQIENSYAATQQKHVRTIPQAAAVGLQRLAQTLPDSPLQQAVARLATRVGAAGDKKTEP